MPDPFTPDVDEEDIDKNENLVQVREYAKRQERRARKLERQMEELTERLSASEKKDQLTAAEQAAKAKGLSDEQWKQLLDLKSEPTAEDVDKFAAMVKGSAVEPPKEGGGPGTEPKPDPAPSDPGFTPAPGSPLPAEGVKWDEIKAAIARGDDAFLTRVAQSAVAGKKVDLGPFSHLIGDTAEAE